MAVTISGSRADSNSGIKETKTEEGSGTFVYDIPTVAITEGGGQRSANWDNAGFGGTVDWASEHVTTYGYICDSYKERQVTDKVSTTQSFASASAGLQITGLGLVIFANDSFQVGIGPSTNLTAARTVTKSEHYGYCINPSPETTTTQSAVPFAQYFLPYIGGGADKLTGKIDPADPNHVKGVYHGTDNITMFSHNTTVITLPLEYTITWDLVLTK